jgi:hypothetical protein
MGNHEFARPDSAGRSALKAAEPVGFVGHLDGRAPL